MPFALSRCTMEVWCCDQGKPRLSVSVKKLLIWKPDQSKRRHQMGSGVWYGLTILNIAVTLKDVPVLSGSHPDWWMTSSCLKETSQVRLSFWFYSDSICGLFCCASSNCGNNSRPQTFFLLCDKTHTPLPPEGLKVILFIFWYPVLFHYVILQGIQRHDF